MNLGPILIMRNTKPTLLSTSRISALSYFEYPKILLRFANPIRNPKRPSLYCFTFISYYRLLYFYIFTILFILLTRNLVIDNQTVELGTQGNLFCFVDFLKRRRGVIICQFPESSIFTLESPLWGKYACYNTLHLESQ
jgi:hypothetical protein